jgi:hypothetical protein
MSMVPATRRKPLNPEITRFSDSIYPCSLMGAFIALVNQRLHFSESKVPIQTGGIRRMHRVGSLRRKNRIERLCKRMFSLIWNSDVGGDDSFRFRTRKFSPPTFTRTRHFLRGTPK